MLKICEVENDANGTGLLGLLASKTSDEVHGKHRNRYHQSLDLVIKFYRSSFTEIDGTCSASSICSSDLKAILSEVGSDLPCDAQIKEVIPWLFFDHRPPRYPRHATLDLLVDGDSIRGKHQP